MPPKLPLPHKRRACSLLNCPCGEGSCAATKRQKLSRGNFCLVASRCLAGPSGFYFADMSSSSYNQERKRRHMNLRKIVGAPAGCPWNTRWDKQGSTGRSPAVSHGLPVVICGLRVGTRGLEPPQGASGKTGPLRGL